MVATARRRARTRPGFVWPPRPWGGGHRLEAARPTQRERDAREPISRRGLLPEQARPGGIGPWRGGRGEDRDRGGCLRRRRRSGLGAGEPHPQQPGREGSDEADVPHPRLQGHDDEVGSLDEGGRRVAGRPEVAARDQQPRSGAERGRRDVVTLEDLVGDDGEIRPARRQLAQHDLREPVHGGRVQHHAAAHAWHRGWIGGNGAGGEGGQLAYGTAASRSQGLATNAVGAGEGLIAGDGLWALGEGTAGPWTPYPRAAPAARGSPRR